MSAFLVRLFSVLRFEAVIHEFDPYFNFRTTKFLSSEGADALHGWFDDRAWYPLGRILGTTVYPGLMMTAAAVHWVLHALNLSVNIRNVCVFLAPWMASNTAIVAYLLGKEVATGPRRGMTDAEAKAAGARRARAEATGLLSGAFMALVPGYISRSAAGSFDNEGVAIFALMATYYLWVRAVNTGSLAWSAASTLAYLYMASSWGGYVFIINLIPLHVIVCILAGKYSPRLYVAYSTFYVLGTLLSMQVSFIGFQAAYSAEHMAAAATFGLVQARWLVDSVRRMYGPERRQEFQQLKQAAYVAAASLFVLCAFVGIVSGYLAPFTGRFYALLDPTYARDNLPIIASVSEHQPTAWASFFFDLHILVILIPVGAWHCCKEPTQGRIFLLLYGVTAAYFAGVMVRLMLVLAPVACLLGAIAVTDTLWPFMGYIHGMPAVKALLRGDSPGSSGGGGVSSADGSMRASPARGAERAGGKGNKPARKLAAQEREEDRRSDYATFGVLVSLGATMMMVMYATHAAWATVEAYSSPSIVLAAQQNDGSRLMFDDFREAYWWLRLNTPEDAKVMSWWDYGYQITAMANRTVLVDNNTWNNTHIATVGLAMSSTEDGAMPIIRSLDVDYVLVIFGGLTGFSSDDIAKFLWMVRISGAEFPQINEADYYGRGGSFRVDKHGSSALLNSLMYKLCYHRFGRVTSDYGRAPGYDRVRNVDIGNKDFALEHFEEVMTTEHWIVRIYRVKEPDNRL